MLTSLDLVDCGCARGCCLDLDEVDEPLDAGGCNTVVDPRGEAVGVASDVCAIKYDVDDSRRARDGLGHYVRVSGVTVHL